MTTGISAAKSSLDTVAAASGLASPVGFGAAAPPLAAAVFSAGPAGFLSSGLDVESGFVLSSGLPWSPDFGDSGRLDLSPGLAASAGLAEPPAAPVSTLAATSAGLAFRIRFSTRLSSTKRRLRSWYV